MSADESRAPLFRVALVEPEEGDVYRQVVILAFDPEDAEGPSTGARSSIRWSGTALDAEELADTLRRVGKRGMRLDQRDLEREHEQQKAREKRERECEAGKGKGK